MASSRQIQVMKLRVMEKLDDIFSQQKTIIATINTMSSQVKKQADRLLKSVSNEVTVSDFVNVLQDLERCFNNLIAIAATTEDLFTFNAPNSNSFCKSKNVPTQNSLSEYQVKWSNQEIPEFHAPQRASAFSMAQPNIGTSFSRFSDVESIDPQPLLCDSQNYSKSWTTDQYLPGCNNSVNFCSSQTVALYEQIASVKALDPQVGTVFTSELESVPHQQWVNFGSDSDLESNSTSLSRSPVKDIASIPNIVSVPPFSPRSLSTEEPYGMGPELKYQKVMSVMNVQVCETVTPYCFWVQISSSVHLLEELASEIRCFITSKYNLNVVYGIACPYVGMTCIAPFTDGSYYRARVLSVLETQNPDPTLDTKVNVLYVDYGNMDVIPNTSLIKMPKSLAKFPTQAICCSLAKVMPNEIDDDWSACSSEAFHNMVYCKDFVCNPVYGDNFIPQIVDLYLLESTPHMTLEDLQTRQESKVSSILIEQGYAQHITESSQIRKIYQIIKNWILFKSNFSPDESQNMMAKKNPPAPFVRMHQANDNFELHHQSFQVDKESKNLDVQVPVSGQMEASSAQGAFPVTCSKSPMLDYEASENNLFCSSGTGLDQSLLCSSTKISRQVTALKENCIPDFKNSLETTNSQAVFSKLDNSLVTTSTETAITSSAKDCSNKLHGPVENLPDPLAQPSVHRSSPKTSLSSDLESVNSKSDSNGFHAVMISHVESPSSFYVHHITKETSVQLEKLVKDMNADFNWLTPSQLAKSASEVIIENGRLCCAYFASDQMYYRGLIIEKTDASEGVLAKVFFLDFGNSDWLHCDKIYSLPQPYSKMPALARHCALAYVQPEGPAWPDEAKTAFKNMIMVKETYFIKMVGGNSPLDIPSLENYKKAPVEVLMTNCYGSTANGSANAENEKTEICLNYELIEMKHADLDVDSFKNTCFVNWDPMLEDFDSRRNCYEMNIDDAEIAAVGFKVKDEIKICKFFRDGRKCWLGKNCPYKHIHLEKDCLTTDKREAVCDVGLLGQIELPLVRSLVGIEVSAVSSPVQFYVIFPWGTESVKNLNSMPVCPNKEETLPDLQESLQEYYKKLRPRAEENLLWTIGELVAARAPADEQWYRARITEVNDTSNTVKVFFVDFGNVQWIPEKHIQPIRPQFVHLPHQAVECCLDGIASTSTDGLWTQEARDYFLELVDDVVLVARVNSIISKRLYIDLYNTSKEEDQNIAEELVRVGVARKISPKAKPSKKKSPVKMTGKPESTKNVLLTPG